jgi:hypothetical protein
MLTNAAFSEAGTTLGIPTWLIGFVEEKPELNFSSQIMIIIYSKVAAKTVGPSHSAAESFLLCSLSSISEA